MIAEREPRRVTIFAAASLSLGLIVVFAAVLRLWSLGAKSLWYDEAYSLFMARHSLREMVGMLATYDNHPPLYYAFLHLWMRLVGDGDVAVRLPSAAASLGAVVATFLLARRVADGRVAVLAATLMAVSPFQVVAAQEARMYPFLTLCAVGASSALWLALRVPRRRSWLAYVVWMLLALYTHYLAILLLVAHGVYVAAVEREQAAVWLRWTGVVVLAIVPLLLLAWPQLATARALPAFQQPLAWRALVDLMGLLSFGGGLFGAGTYYRRGTLPPLLQIGLLLPFLVLALVGLTRMGSRQRTFLASCVLVPIALTALIAIRNDVFQERYFSFVHPPFAIMLGAGIVSLLAGRGLARSVLVGAGVPLLVGLTVAALVGVNRDHPAYDWRGAGRYVTAEARADDVLLYVPPFVAIPFEHYYRGGQARPRLPSAEVLASAKQAAQGKLRLRTTVPVGELTALARTHPRMWLVSSVALGPRVAVGMAEVLAPHFRQVEERRFGLVSISLWESRPLGSGRQP
jgi:4-amino-4-deoxy-L-arabinose transferase-like glycosyltransferase